MQAINLVNSSTVNSREGSDFYPTPPDVTHALMKFLKLPSKNYTIWEPACGDGLMSKVLSEYCENVISTDIRTDSGFGEGGIDFLNTNRKCDAIITNPPFNISEQFIRHALEINSDGVVAMLLKSQYWHAKKRLSLFNEFTPAYILPLTWRPDFMFGKRGGAPTMEVLWTVWISGVKCSIYHPLSRP